MKIELIDGQAIEDVWLSGGFVKADTEDDICYYSTKTGKPIDIGNGDVWNTVNGSMLVQYEGTRTTTDEFGDEDEEYYEYYVIYNSEGNVVVRGEDNEYFALIGKNAYARIATESVQTDEDYFARRYTASLYNMDGNLVKVRGER